MTFIHPAVALATAVLTVAQINEDSFDEETGLYGISTQEACDTFFGGEVTNTLHRPVLTLLVLDWNGTVEWATGIIEAYVPEAQEEAAA